MKKELLKLLETNKESEKAINEVLKLLEPACPFKHDELIAVGGDTLRHFKEMKNGKYICYNNNRSSKETSRVAVWNDAAPVILFTLHDGKGVPNVPDWVSWVNVRAKDGRTDWCFSSGMNAYKFIWENVPEDIIGYEFIKVD